MIKRLFDILFSAAGLLLLSPFLIFISVVIAAGSKGGVFYKQTRVGKNGRDFILYKFRTMFPGSDKKGLLTVGGNDNRITRTGRFLRKYKLDEIPQLINVLAGDMSLVGPRPEVRKYADLYTGEQKKVLSVKPGITDYASIEYINESELLGKADDPEKFYITEVMPAKLKLNLKYIATRSLAADLKIILQTIFRIIKSDS